MALVAEDGLALGVFETEVIWGFFIASAVPRIVKTRTLIGIRFYLLWLWSSTLIVLSLGAGLHIDKGLANILGQVEGAGVLLLEAVV